MPSVTTWRRLEPRSRSEALPSISARVADPLWMVARQWQSGELTGSDAGSPILVRLKAEHTPITRWANGAAAPGGSGEQLPAGRVIEDFVDSVRPRIGLADRARGGRHFARLLGGLASRYAPKYRQAFGLPAPTPAERDASDDAGIRWSRLLAGRAIDGAALRAVLGSSDAPVLPPVPDVDSADLPDVLAAAKAFAEWWDEQFPIKQGSWIPSRLASPFQLGASTSSGPITLVAPEHRGRRIDWHSFEAGPGTMLASGDAPSSAGAAATSLPARMSFPGMPRHRWWEFEDAATDLGRIEAAPDDLARLLMAEFALVYGNDFFAVPVAVRVGSVCRVLELEVETCFGDRITVPSAVDHDGSVSGRRTWRMFHGDPVVFSGAKSPGLIVAPTAVGEIRGGAREEVLVSRDEMANVAWAIEVKVTAPSGAVVERREVEHGRRQREERQITTGNTLFYRLSTSVPESWLPLVPVAGGALALQGALKPAGQFMGDVPVFTLDAIELPRTGRRVALRPYRARAADGSVLLWSAWEVGPGRGETSSGLRHDELTHERPPEP